VRERERATERGREQRERFGAGSGFSGTKKAPKREGLQIRLYFVQWTRQCRFTVALNAIGPKKVPSNFSALPFIGTFQISKLP